jgi:Cellulase (glycosyl hydrolase family 5)
MNHQMNRRNFIYQLGAAGTLAAMPVFGQDSPKAAPAPMLPAGAGHPQPKQGIGVNYFDLFQRLLRKPTETSHLENLSQLTRANIPFARFACCGFWPADWDMYQEKRAEYFRLLDLVVRAAEQAKLGLIPSLFWLHSAVPDLMKEPMQELGNPHSKSVAFIRQYTREVVSRYENSPAIWGWELGNEYNLVVDLPNAASRRPPVHPTLKTALQRTEKDELRASDLVSLSTEFGKAVRDIDSKRLLITGHAAPRTSAWHNTHERNWKPDTLEQFGEVLLRDNPDPFDTLSVHVYPEKTYPGRTQSVDEFIDASMKVAQQARKKLFVGEFGAARAKDSESTRTSFENLVKALVKHRVPLAAVWVYDFPGQDRDWNITFKNDRAFMLEMISKANLELRTAR